MSSAIAKQSSFTVPIMKQVLGAISLGGGAKCRNVTFKSRRRWGGQSDSENHLPHYGVDLSYRAFGPSRMYGSRTAYALCVYTSLIECLALVVSLGIFRKSLALSQLRHRIVQLCIREPYSLMPCGQTLNSITGRLLGDGSFCDNLADCWLHTNWTFTARAEKRQSCRIRYRHCTSIRA